MISEKKGGKVGGKRVAMGVVKMVEIKLIKKVLKWRLRCSNLKYLNFA